MTKQILLSLLNCSWQWMLLSGLIWFVASSRFHKNRRSNTTVHLLWLLSLLSLPILFGLNQFVPAPAISGNPMPELEQAQPINVSGLAALTTDFPEISSVESDTQSKNQLFAGSESFFNWIKTDLLLYLWAIGALAMLARFMFGLYRIYQLRHRAVVADDPYQAICQRLAQQLDIKRQVTVCFSKRVASPISFGWLSPYILIPRQLNLEQFELVAAHELAHVQRLDWLTNLFSHVVGVIFFFHPIYHFLNRELVHLRERICDDWVIQLTGSRKNYAQCLLDLVRHTDRTIPLALSLNQPSQLESRIDSILKSDRQLDVQLKPRLRLMVATLLLTCLPLLAMAQLVPLKTFQVSLFAQTPEKSEEAVDKTAEKQDMQKAKVEKMGKKEYEDKSYIKVEDPTLVERSEENKIFSGPQPGEKLPPLKVTGVRGETDGKTFDVTTEVNGEPLVLFLQDTNAVGIKGLVNVSGLLLKIDAFQKRHSKTTGDAKSNQGFQMGVVFLADSLDTLPDWAHNMLNEEIPNEILTGISPEGREGPGSYGLNRNVAQTVLIAKDGKVLHNFAFTQPMLYSDPHFLGAVANAIGADAPALEKWLNEETAKRRYEKNVKAAIIKEIDDTSGGAHNWLELRNLTDNELNLKGWTLEIDTTELDTKEKLTQFTNTDNKLNLKGWTLEIDTTELDTERWLIRFKTDVKLPANGFLLLDAESLEKLGVTLEEGEKLLNKTKETSQKMDRRQYRNQRQVKIANPAAFNTSEENKIFSGPQPGEKLPPLLATGIRGSAKDITFDFIAKADGRLHVLLLQDESGVGLRGLYDIAGVVDKISNKSDKDLHMSVVFFSNDPAALKKITQHVPKNVLVGVFPGGREGPGNYGLNRNTAQTVIIAKDRKVLHNFAFKQPLLYANPHVIGAIAQTIGEDPSTVEKWLNEASADEERMQRGKEKTEGKGNHKEGLVEQPKVVQEGLQPSVESVSTVKRESQKRELDRLEKLVEQVDADLEELRQRLQSSVESVSAAKQKRENRYRRENVEVKNPAEFKKVQGATRFSGPQPGEKLPPLKVKGINGDVKDKTYDVIAKADGHVLVLFLQDESGLGLRGLLGVSRLLAKIAEKSKQPMLMNAVFLGDAPDALESQASKLVPHIPSEVLLSVSQDGREGPGSYGLNRNVAQTVIIAKGGKVLHNFAFTQPMLRPDPYLLGAVGEAVGVKPVTLEKWLNEKGLVIKINNPTAKNKMGEILLNGTVIQFDELSARLLNLPEEQKSTLTIQAGRDVLHEQTVRVMDIAKEAGIDQIEFALSPAEDKSMKPDKAQGHRSKDSD
ncbi:hypothetical protein J5I95_07765 [Candidatus Poribacteria bacterium]|nr:hypothetical protein [Candidatus Poribacteria bacterium]